MVKVLPPARLSPSFHAAIQQGKFQGINLAAHADRLRKLKVEEFASEGSVSHNLR